jgi:wobble nucleotide-excising tRNase
MIEAITEITNVGTFYSFKTDNPVRFSKLTLLYGPNGTGKTTLCAIFRSLARNDPAILQGRKTLGRQGTARVEIELSGGRKCIWDGSQWSGEAPPIEIYDEEFVRQNLYTDSVDVEHKRNLLRVVLGEEPTRLANEIARLDQQGRETQKEITRLENDLKAIVRDLMTLDEFLSLPEDPEIASKIDAKKAEVEAHRDAEAIKKLDKLERLRVPEPPADLEPLCARTIDDVAADAEQRLREHLKRCRIEDESWLQKGLGFVHDETCPFCGQSLAGVRELIAAYRAVFSDTYRNLKAGVEQARKTVEHSFGEAAAGKIAECLAENRRRADSWQKYGVQDLDAWEISCDWRTAFKEFHDAALELLNRKAGALLEAVPSDRLRPAREKLDAALTALRCYNKTVESLNERIANLQGRVSTDRLDAARQQLQRLELVSKRYEHEIQKKL